MAHDADRPVAVDVEAEVGVGRHFRQVEAGVVGQARRKMQVGGRVGLEKAERRPALVDLLRFGQPPRVGGALVVVDGEARQTELRRDDEMAAEGDHGRDDERRQGAPRAGKEATTTCRRPPTSPAARRSGRPAERHTSRRGRRGRSGPSRPDRRNRRGRTSCCSSGTRSRGTRRRRGTASTRRGRSRRASISGWDPRPDRSG